MSMTTTESLRDRVEWFVENGGHRDDLVHLLRECVAAEGFDGLVGVRRLFEHMYGGFTFNYELKAPAASSLLIWKELGLKALMEGVKFCPESKNVSIAMQLLASVAAGDGLPLLATVPDAELNQKILRAIGSDPALSASARGHLVDLILSFDNDDEVSSRIGLALQSMSFSGGGAAREIFAAVSKRWLAVSTPVLDSFEALIRDEPDNEPAFQAFLTAHPQILDPLAIRVWPQPDLFGFKEPDYVVQRADGTYMVVEIECPAKKLVTNGGHLTAEVTHAESQAADYRRYLIKHFSESEKHFPTFQEPDCLVIVGLERPLASTQKQALNDANNNRNHMRIVGFDWLLDRARTIAQNVTQPTVEVIALRVN